MSIVKWEDIYLPRNATVNVSATEGQLSESRLGKPRRKSFVVVPLTAGVDVTITKGDQAAVANAGVLITQNQPFVEADSEGFESWQGQYRVVATGAGSVALLEVFAPI